MTNSPDGEIFGIDHPNFTLTGRVERDPDGRVTCLTTCSQNYIHNGKKMSYPLDHATRTLCLGGHTAHMNHLIMVTEQFPYHEHGLREEDVHQHDRQNWGFSTAHVFSSNAELSFTELKMERMKDLKMFFITPYL